MSWKTYKDSTDFTEMTRITKRINLNKEETPDPLVRAPPTPRPTSSKYHRYNLLRGSPCHLIQDIRG